MNTRKVLNMVKDFQHFNHIYKNTPLGRAFGQYWGYELTKNAYEDAYELTGDVCSTQYDRIDHERRRISEGWLFTASNYEIVKWFKGHKSNRGRQLVKAYGLIV